MAWAAQEAAYLREAIFWHFNKPQGNLLSDGPGEEEVVTSTLESSSPVGSPQLVSQEIALLADVRTLHDNFRDVVLHRDAQLDEISRRYTFGDEVHAAAEINQVIEAYCQEKREVERRLNIIKDALEDLFPDHIFEDVEAVQQMTANEPDRPGLEFSSPEEEVLSRSAPTGSA
ncbi:hypothetical protein CspeluHIS016_0503010 [Cutaneotrichosporon spelunceum]|uniref:Uncharacterized protein n=1 Tax=Cutaneotrichosporon spelunceum TaxID=1672016 RepID=A0AAD3YDT2_9TREE|nr:hypothetical protein CspeluHIS016_0503010 [Cutaneotrichosporon spelunceum]